MKLFELRRDVDVGGISGTGVVAQGVIFDNGWCALAWLTEHRSVAFYTSIDEVVAIHGHAGATRVVQIADVNSATVSALCTNRAQDDIEGVGLDFLKGNHKYLWEQRERFADLFAEKRLDQP